MLLDMPNNDGDHCPDTVRSWYLPSMSAVASLLIGVLLLTTAGLKCHQLAWLLKTEGPVRVPWFALSLIIAEFSLGIWLLSQWNPHSAWLLSLCLFVAFTSYSLIALLRGSESCGCLGRVAMPPSLTLLVDIVSVALLVAFPPFTARAANAADRRCGIVAYISSLTKSHYALLAFPLIVAGAAAGWIASPSGSEVRLSPERESIVLQPEVWDGKTFPLFGYIDRSEELRLGRWLVVIYHHDCERCLAAIVERLPMSSSGTERLALLELPPYGKLPYDSPVGSALHRRLSPSKNWIATTPIEVRIDHGVVYSVTYTER